MTPALAALLALAAPDVAPAAEPCGDGSRYFVAMFASQRNAWQAKYAHTFGTVLKVTPGAAVETRTISWLPATGDVRVLAVRSEPGRNFGLEETVRLALSQGESVSMWGPYEVRKRFHDRFTDRAADLDAGRLRYRAVDNLIRETDVTDCIHAITDIDPKFNRGRYPLNRYGDRATAFIVDQLRTRGVLVGGARTHDEVIPALGLAAYPIARREPPPEIAYPLADFGLAVRPQSRMVRR